uniref:Para aminobenzoic acid synthetase n=1 Tax=Ganoderma boninense TaxID=34458 RepID=A0A5K1K8S5_9APHY|nr:Para aminobenzoic acid synthetase [Ganoderma boninense]
MTSKSIKRAAKKTHLCAGCDRKFTAVGRKRHLRQTSKPNCIAVRDSEQVSDSQDSDDNNRSSTPSTSSPRSSPAADAPDLPQPFTGDFYGEYTAEDFDDYLEYDADCDNEDDDDGVGSGDEEAGAGDPEDADAGEDDDEDAANFEEEHGWEPPPADAFDLVPDPDGDGDHTVDGEGEPGSTQRRANEHLHTRTFAIRFPGPHAGSPLSQQQESTLYEQYENMSHSDDDLNNNYYPFKSRLDWKIAKWAKMRGPGSTAVSELLDIDDLVEILGLSFKNSWELNMIIDEKLTSGRPRFIRREIVVAGESFEVFYRDVIQCVRALYGDPEFAGILVFAPERHYADPDHTVRVYFDMHTGRWWWDTQKELEKRKPGATIIPIIISSDKTQLTVFGSKTAYPVYLTIGNLPKDVRRKPSRRGQILLAYLPSSRLEHITSKAARRRVVANLFHHCLSTILKPLIKAGIFGISVTSGDGVVRRGHPIFAMYISDYPEQLLVTCCKNKTCPKCDIDPSEIGDHTEVNRPLRDLANILAALAEVGNSPAAFRRSCREAGIKPVVHPFWEKLPFVHIFRSITPDILHQLYQGVIRHLVNWLKAAFGPEELDARCRRLPPNQQLRAFPKGITTLQKVTGKEHADICRFLLGLVTGLPLRSQAGLSPVRLIRAVRAILDFLYLAQYLAHTSETLELLTNALRRFHQNKAIFIDLAIRDNWHIPKLHSLDHYLISIKLFGTTDNYDTQYTERLHIDFAKDAYRATNRKDEFPQMTLWLERREKVLRHEAYIQWRLGRRAARAQVDPSGGLTGSVSSAPSRTQPSTNPSIISTLPKKPLTQMMLAKWPSIKALRFQPAASLYGVNQLQDALARFIAKYRDPTLSDHQVKQAAQHTVFRFGAVPVWHKIKLVLEDAQHLGVMEVIRDTVHARPERKDSQGRTVPARFDTVLVNDGTGGFLGVEGYRVRRVRLIFKVPERAHEQLFSGVIVPGHLAYVEWFSPFTQPDRIHEI